MVSQFEESGAARPAVTPAANQASAAVRFRTLTQAVSAALKGDWHAPLPLEGADQLTLLAQNLQALFDKMRQQPAPPQADLQRANERLEYLIANTPAIIYSSVPTGDFKMTFVSDNAARVLGYQAAEMLADPNFWFEHIHPDDIPLIFASLAQLFVDGQRTYEYRFRASDGAYLWMHDTLRLIRDARGEPLEVIGSLTEITDRKRMEETLQKKGEEQQLLIDKLKQAQAQLLQSEKMASIGQLAAGIAHEINNPIGFVNSNMGSLRKYVDTLFTVIDGYEKLLAPLCTDATLAAAVSALKSRADIDFLRTDVTDLVRESLDGLKRVTEIVQSLKDFSHVGETDWQMTDLHHGLDSTLNIAANEFRYKAKVLREYGKLPLVRCLASQLNQVFMNLIVNASHAIKEDGLITIRSGAADDWVWISISDNGVGIPAENLGRIFEPFFTTKPVGSGTGLGLSLSYNIVQSHGGRIEVTSETGQGTCFTLHLPVNSGPA